MQSTVTTLTVPEIPEDADIISAAIAYANAGFYVLAVEPDTKRPAAFYGKGWPHMSSRDAQEIVYWFASSPYQLALHIGRSGAVAFDVDEPDKIPAILQRAFDEHRPPMQSTRSTGGRGHRLFQVPDGRRLGNSVGGLGRGWGDVRGRNGIIVVEPSFHTKHNDGGRYKWLTTGSVPILPDYVAELLPDAGIDTEAATDAVVRQFLDEYTEQRRSALLTAVLNKFSKELGEGSRHEALVRNLVWAMREARLGWYPAQIAADTMQAMFVNAMGGERHPIPEFHGALAFAVAQALLVDPDERRDEASARLRARDAAKKAAINVTSTDGTAARPKQRPRDPGDYFYDKNAGIDIEMVVRDVLSLGPIAVGPNHDFWTYDAGVWRSNPKEVSKRVWRLLGPRYRGSHATNAEHGTLAEAMEIAVNPVSDYMNFANGMLEWRTGELHDHSPHYGSTVQFPLEWHPEAECPQFDDFLATIFSEDYIELAWQMLGYLMYSGNPHQKAFLFLGSGANGKGTLMRVIEALLGGDNCSTESLDDLNQNRFAAYSLFGKIANLAGDIDATYQTSTAAFKKLTGEDMYAGERKYGDRFNFKAWAVPVFSANKIPGSVDASEGYLRRWIILKFDRTFSEKERIAGLSDRLVAELPGIAAKAVKALHGVIDGPGFKLDGEVAQAKEEFAEAIDQVRQWMGECTIPAPGAQVPRAKVYASYKFWAASNGHRVLSANELYQRINSAAKNGAKIEKKIRGNRVFVDFEVVDFKANPIGVPSDQLPDAFGSED